MIAEGYGDKRTIARRIAKMEAWLRDPQLLEADAGATYAAEIHINLEDIKEPILCAPNDPDDARLLSEVQGKKIDEVFIGSCMTNIGHFRAAGKLLSKYEGQLPTRLWIAPPTRMDETQLVRDITVPMVKLVLELKCLAVLYVWAIKPELPIKALLCPHPHVTSRIA